MENLKNALNYKITDSLKNDFGEENYDENRFGSYNSPKVADKANSTSTYKPSLKKKLKNTIKKVIGYNNENKVFKRRVDKLIDPFQKQLNNLWEVLSDNDKSLLIDLLAFRILGHKRVKLSLNTPEYWEQLDKLKDLSDEKDIIDPKFLHFVLKKFNLNPIGYNIVFYYTEAGVLTDFVLEQYAYKTNGIAVVEVEKGDVVFDCGGCWGDTALYFSHKTGNTGKVYSFEFIPGNINIFEKNVNLNTHLKPTIQLVKKPVSNKGNETIYYKDNGPASVVKFEPFQEQTGKVKTVSIDEFVENNNIDKVDFIKMDIEGAEPLALEGALKTIKRFKPKLAIAIYHSMDDFVNIPNWIQDLNLDYEIFIGHYKIFAEETICFARPKV